MSLLLSQAQIDELLDFDSASTTAVTAATTATPVQITSVAHGLVSGNWAIVLNALGNTGANGIYPVLWVDVDNVTLTGSVGAGAYTSGGTIAKVTAGLVGLLKPGEMGDLEAALRRVPYLQGTDADRTVESTLKDIIGS